MESKNRIKERNKKTTDLGRCLRETNEVAMCQVFNSAPFLSQKHWNLQGKDFAKLSWKEVLNVLKNRPSGMKGNL